MCLALARWVADNHPPSGPLRKQCCVCETVADPHPENDFGDLGGWTNCSRGWVCPNCPRPRHDRSRH